MPQLRNPTDFRLSCYVLGRSLDPGECVEITEEQADELARNAVFVVERKPSAKPTRATAKRGGKRAEVTKAPNVEKRG